ncbi:DUF1835 domain-containing protein [Lederbergia galactosidilytica]|uniref:DUF1835 domain-containing protein n=1 Tax=Lederbergia galactosidilytica TaxID=217031 RepID=A0A0Q9XXE9_9BACI|nr:DUF1835 domain-containing protein [Lederbergia galactosidilytica]KRG11897.1 hypothetical protein ACA29_13430 [Lederbergia galactosidilytica]KRG12309.1 hypothetical protein ACA30_19720 [Virgibacillus soli]OAK73927.1 hypothetical protein ABB05_05740 [Lederbergia galactosidilytica]
MNENLRNSINQLSESEAKSILLQTMLRLKKIPESNESQRQMIKDLHVWWNLKFAQSSKKCTEMEYKTVHIVCGESTTGSLKFGLEHGNKVIGFPDFFAAGPIWKLHEEEGRTHRYEWLRDHLNIEDDFIEKEYQKRFSKTLAELEAIPDHVPIVLWTGENAGEQTGIRYLLYMLKEKPNDAFLINTTLAYQELYNTNEIQYFCFHTGEVHPEKLNDIYQKNLPEALTLEERSRFEKEWITLSNTKGVVRILEDHIIKEVGEDYFDELLITAAQNLHKQKGKDFIRTGRLIGEVLGQIDGMVGDSFLEYRVRCLINQGVFEIKGILKAMRYYRVKLRE